MAKLPSQPAKNHLLHRESQAIRKGLGLVHTFDYMPKQYIQFRWEYDYRHATRPYGLAWWVTPPGGHNRVPGAFVVRAE